MIVDLKREDLEALVIGTDVNYSEFFNPLLIKAGHEYGEQYGSSWDNLSDLTDKELYELYIICKNSWDK